MKLRGYILILIAVWSAGSVSAQDSTRVGNSKDRWYVPDFAVLQYAGSIGFLSAGAGYTVFRDKANVDVLVGFVPASMGGLETITLKFTSMPWKIRLNPSVTLRPLTIGTYFCYTPGREYSSNLPSWYPDGYYWWSEAVRVNLFIGGSANLTTDRIKHIRKAELYYEVGTNEIKLVSYVQNTGYLSAWKILHLGIGVRAYFSK